MPSTHLPDRAVVRVTGADAGGFLQNLITCDVETLRPGEARLGALLSPQGKIQFDFLLNVGGEDVGGGYWFDVKRALAADLAKKLSFYKLRAKVVVEDLTDRLGVVAGWADTRPPDDEVGLVLRDGRAPNIGWRAIVAADAAAAFGIDPDGYHAHRILLGVPEGGADFVYGDAFPHETLMDQMGGVDFRKGCYVGQEVVSRMQHRSTARTRIVPVNFRDGIAALDGMEVMAGEKVAGRLGSTAAGRGLAMLRLDRVADALAAGITLSAGGLALDVVVPDWVSFALPPAG